MILSMFRNCSQCRGGQDGSSKESRCKGLHNDGERACESVCDVRVYVIAVCAEMMNR